MRGRRTAGGRGRPGRVLVCGAVLTAGLLLGAPVAATATVGSPPPAGTISGLVSTPPGVSANQVTVWLDPVSPGVSGTQQGLGPDGTFSLAGVSPGTYQLRFSTWNHEMGGGFPTQYYDGVESAGNATPLILAPGESITGLQETLLAGGTISGRITDENGNPIQGATVSAVDNLVPDTLAPDLSPLGSDTTAADGSYTIGGLPDADVYVMVTAWPVPPLAEQVYPGVTAYPDASTVHVANGTTTSGINVSLPEGGTVTGNVIDANGSASAAMTLYRIENGVPEQTRTTWPFGPYSVLFAPGTYIARYTAVGSETRWSGNVADEAQAVPFTITAGTTTVTPDIVMEPDGYVPPASSGAAATAAPVVTSVRAPFQRTVVPAPAPALPTVAFPRLTVGGDGIALLWLRCAGPAICSGVARLELTVRSAPGARRRTMVVASMRYAMGAGGRASLRVRLTRAGFAQLAKHRGRMNVSLLLTSSRRTYRSRIELTRSVARLPLSAR